MASIEAVYAKKNPAKLRPENRQKLDSLFQKYKGWEVALYKKICATYWLPVQKQNGEWILYAAAGNDISDGGEFADNADNDEGGGGDKKSGAGEAGPTQNNIFGGSSNSGKNIFGKSTAPAGDSTPNNIFGSVATSTPNIFSAATSSAIGSSSD